MEKNDKRLWFVCRGYGNQDIFCRVADLTPDDMKKINHLLAEQDIRKRRAGNTGGDNNIIVEAYYNPSKGIWQIHGVRQDKNQPNHITVVFDTLESISENITREEIVHLLTS